MLFHVPSLTDSSTVKKPYRWKAGNITSVLGVKALGRLPSPKEMQVHTSRRNAQGLQTDYEDCWLASPLQPFQSSLCLQKLQGAPQSTTTTNEAFKLNARSMITMIPFHQWHFSENTHNHYCVTSATLSGLKTQAPTIATFSATAGRESDRCGVAVRVCFN